MSLKKAFLATTLALTSGLAIADGVDYDYLDIGYIDFDGADGMNFELSKEFSKNFYGRIDYTDLDGDTGGELKTKRFNLGYKTGLGSNLDFLAELGYEDIDLNTGFGSASDDGYNARLGLRGMVANNFELGGYATYSDVLESTDLTVEGRYHFNDRFSMALELGNDEETDEHYGVSFRYNF